MNTPIAFTCVMEYPPSEVVCGVFDPDSGSALEYCQLCHNPNYKDIWEAFYANELERLCQGIDKGVGRQGLCPVYSRKGHI